MCTVISAQTKSVPTWLDTIPPVISVLPEKRFHAAPFFVSLKANEAATIWVGIDSPQNMAVYRKNINVATEGKTTLYFFGEDMYGNKSIRDTASFVLDFQSPKLTISPDPGIYHTMVTVSVTCDEPCRLFKHVDPSGKDKVPCENAFIVTREFSGYISAIDQAGNMTQSDELSYIVDTTSVSVSVQPKPGMYNRIIDISFKASRNARIFYTFDPNVSPERFVPYSVPTTCPYGLTPVRYYARNSSGKESPIMKANFIVDTVPPKIKGTVTKGAIADIVTLVTREPAEIRYSFDKSASFEGSMLYTGPLEIPHAGKVFFKALARDQAGNMSQRYVWEHKYDMSPPIVRPSHMSSTYTRPFTLSFTTSEPAHIYYTMDGSAPNETSVRYKDGIVISKSGLTDIRYTAIDEADNRSMEGRLEFNLDGEPPRVKVRVEGTAKEDEFRVFIESTEPVEIYYETGGQAPTTSSPRYTQAITMRTGEVLRYFARDNAGNRTETFTMDDLKKPVVSIKPEGGIYRYQIPILFTGTATSSIYWRILPDTLFRRYQDSLVLNKEGIYTLEYYSESSGGFKSPIRRQQYVLDWTPPRISLSVKKGIGDSVSVFFDCSENATIYYTIDGTSPFFSKTTQTAGNKFTKSKDRISVLRSGEAKLAFYAEDVAGNQGTISVLDIFKPHPVPNIPAGTKRIYDRILSLSLNTYDERSQIYYERHGVEPTSGSPLYAAPITLLRSDTIKSFVIDASGFRGETETFIFLIDLPPSPHFAYTPAVAHIDDVVTFNASGTFDQESRTGDLLFRWDFDGDGVIDSEKKGEPLVTHAYHGPGAYTVGLEVVDPLKRSARVTQEVRVMGICPPGMVFVPRAQGRSYCVDKYEWPNRKGKLPEMQVSWVRAKMYCYDEGKRLCTEDEWQYACSGRVQKKVQGTTLGRYPYGVEYEAGRCPTEGEKIFKAGQFDRCHEEFGTYDMVGNVWEWVADKKNGAPVMVGGSFQYGNKASCGLSSEGSLSGELENTGFRCCK